MFEGADDHGTAHVVVVAPDGSVVSATSTINYIWGSQRRSTSLGFMLNNEMDDFAIPNTASAYGMPPSPANMLAPGLQPLSSMVPTVVLDRNREAQLVIGAAGGTKITTQVALPLSSMVPTVVLDRNREAQLVIGAAGGTKITTQVALVSRGCMIDVAPCSMVPTVVLDRNREAQLVIGAAVGTKITTQVALPLSSMVPTVVLDRNREAQLVIGAAGGTKITTQVALPLSSMVPTVVLDRNREAQLVIGAAGGTKITTQVALVSRDSLTDVATPYRRPSQYAVFGTAAAQLNGAYCRAGQEQAGAAGDRSRGRHQDHHASRSGK
ncbi:gamma-glutamyltranspeptidase domain-containing protein [Phthorimaea operculella]|nr:gamma-glutamyltranspeptidase domain-containing protein [Phthorimaea operculella]